MKRYFINILFLIVLGIAVATSAETFSLVWWIFHAWATLVLVVMLIPIFLSMILADSQTLRHLMKVELKKNKPAPWGKNTDAVIDLVIFAGFVSLGWLVASAASIATLIMSQYAFGIYEEIEQENSTGD